MITRTTRATPALIWSRAALLAVVVVAVSTVGHVSADGLLPGPLAMLALVVAATLVSARFLTRRASPARLIVLLVSGQFAIHGVLTVLAGHGSPALTGADGAAGHGAEAAAGGRFVFDGLQGERSGSYFDQVEAMQRAGATVASTGDFTGDFTGADSSALGHLVDHLAAQSPVMVLTHLAVVVLLGAWLAVGEQALWTVLALSTTRLLDVVDRVGLLALGRWSAVLLDRVRRAPFLATTRRAVVPLPHLLHHVVAHRGPPALLAA